MSVKVVAVEQIAVDRTLPALVLDRSPLLYFLAQVRFTAILEMEKKISAVQERLRKMGYVHFATSQAFNVTVTPNAAPKVESVPLWSFTTGDRASGIVVSNEFFTYQCVDYGRYEETLPKIIEALRAVHEVAEIGYFERLGLRYLDVVIPDRANGESFATYLKNELIGISGAAIKVETLHHNTVFVGRTEMNGTLVVRFTTVNGPNVLPADLAGAPLELRRFDIEPNDRVGVLDFDHYVESGDAFSVDEAQRILGGLHDAINRAFINCVTPTALTIWGKHDAP